MTSLEARSPRMENMLWGTALLPFLLRIYRINRENTREVNEVHGWWVREAGESEAAKSLGLVTRRDGEPRAAFTLTGAGRFMMSSSGTEQRHLGNRGQ